LVKEKQTVISYSFVAEVKRFKTLPTFFYVFLTVHHSIDLFHLPTLMHNSFIH